MNDLDYLAQAGIDAETGGEATAETTPTATTTPNETPAAEVKTTPEAPVEMFEVNGQKYPVSTEFQLTHGGKIMKVPYSKLANTYRQQEHFQDKYKAFNDEKAQFDQVKPDFERYKGFYDKYGHLQEWSEKNPKEWEVLWDLYQNKTQHLLRSQLTPQQQMAQQGSPDQSGLNLDPLLQKIASFEERFGKYDKVISGYEAREQAEKEAKDVDYVKKEIHAFQEEYKDINLNERDPDGVTLWATITQWGLTNGYHEFRPAALVYLDQRVKDSISARARAEALKGFKSDKAGGVVKRSSSPISGQNVGAPQPKNVRSLSYGELANMAKAEIGNYREE